MSQSMAHLVANPSRSIVDSSINGDRVSWCYCRGFGFRATSLPELGLMMLSCRAHCWLKAVVSSAILESKCIELERAKSRLNLIDRTMLFQSSVIASVLQNCSTLCALPVALVMICWQDLIHRWKLDLKGFGTSVFRMHSGCKVRGFVGTICLYAFSCEYSGIKKHNYPWYLMENRHWLRSMPISLV